MNNINIGKSDFFASEIILGCMRINSLSKNELETYIKSAIELGIDIFDHADIYGGGECESIFGDVVKENNLREKIKIQTKCGIRENYYDLSKEHILDSVDKSLQRLKTDYVDMLLLHRPDTLMDVFEVCEAFDILKESGKVKHFGVSNFNSLQVELLKKNTNQKLIANQLQFGVMHSNMISTGIQANTNFDGAVDKDKGILEYSMLNNMTIQAWSPLQHGFFEGIFVDNDKFVELNETLNNLSEKHNASKSAIAISWILNHPSKMQVILGTTNKERLKQMSQTVKLTKKEWYEIYIKAGNRLP